MKSRQNTLRWRRLPLRSTAMASSTLTHVVIVFWALVGISALVDWTPILTNTAGIGPCYFYNPAMTNFTQRFYRLLKP